MNTVCHFCSAPCDAGWCDACGKQQPHGLAASVRQELAVADEPRIRRERATTIKMVAALGCVTVALGAFVAVAASAVDSPLLEIAAGVGVIALLSAVVSFFLGLIAAQAD